MNRDRIAAGIFIAFLAAAALYMRFGFVGWLMAPDAQHAYYIRRGDLVRETWIEEAGTTYRTDESGRRITGIATIGEDTYCFSESGEMQTGWQTAGDRTCYFAEDGKMVTGFAQIDGHTYLFGEDGSMETGWTFSGGDVYCFGEDGAMLTGWQEIGGDRYHFDGDGRMQTGWLRDGEDWYLLAGSGKVLYGEQKADGRYYDLGTDGRMLTGWRETQAGRRYYGEDGAAVTGRAEIDGKRLRFSKQGYLLTGMVEEDGERFCMEADGTVVPGWHTEEEETFYVLDDGYVPDLQAETGNYGRLIIRDCGIDILLEQTDDREEYQGITDEENTALVVEERRDLEPVIADRRSQGFAIAGAVPGETYAYILYADGSIRQFLCSRNVIGQNLEEDVVDDQGVSVWQQNQTGFCTYTGAGREDDSIVVVFWELTEQPG